MRAIFQAVRRRLSRRMLRLPFILAAGSLSWLSAFTPSACSTTSTVCPEPDDPADCGCMGPCKIGEYCNQGACAYSGTEEACGSAKMACGLGERCDRGSCMCDTQLTMDNDAACGCPAVDCVYDVVDHEICVDGGCVCDSTLHDSSDSSCGCPPRRL